MDDSDQNLLKIVRDYMNDMLENTYNSLINEVFNQIKREKVADFDNYHFFKFSAYMIQV